MESKIYQLKLDNGIIHFANGQSSLLLQAGDFCIFQKDFYLEYAQVMKEVDKIPENRPPAPSIQTTAPVSGAGLDSFAPQWNSNSSETVSNKKSELYIIQRKANVIDRGKANENKIRSKSALKTIQQFVIQLKLSMKLINAHFSFDGKLLLVQFSADGRVDFRELVKLLAREFNAHIELRQIGVRDETSILGGIANCGQPLCCCRYLTEFDSINVKMAKEQDLSLTPGTISGICGRLKCCLKYEHEGYVELEKTMPRRGDICECKDGRGRIIDRNLLTQSVTVQMLETSHTAVFPVSEISIVYLDKYKLKKTAKSDGLAPEIATSCAESVVQTSESLNSGKKSAFDSSLSSSEVSGTPGERIRKKSYSGKRKERVEDEEMFRHPNRRREDDENHGRFNHTQKMHGK